MLKYSTRTCKIHKYNILAKVLLLLFFLLKKREKEKRKGKRKQRKERQRRRDIILSAVYPHPEIYSPGFSTLSVPLLLTVRKKIQTRL